MRQCDSVRRRLTEHEEFSCSASGTASDTPAIVVMCRRLVQETPRYRSMAEVQQIARLRAKIAEQAAALSEAQNKLRILEASEKISIASIEEVEAMCEKRVKVLRDSYEARLEEMRRMHDDQAEDIRDIYEKRVKVIKESYQARLDEIEVEDAPIKRGA